MNLEPKIQKQKAFLLRECTRCHQNKASDSFSPTKSYFYPDGFLPICNQCLEEFLEQNEWNWRAVDKLCQYADIPFIPTKFEELHKILGTKVFPKYAEVFFATEYEGLGWDTYFEQFKELKEADLIENELPEIREEKYRKLREIWGPNYDDETLDYLDNLFTGMMATQNINGALQIDQARKLCKISEAIDSRIRGGDDFDKILTAYDKLVKVAEFTPRNSKNENDFDSVGEIFTWMEKRGWQNNFFDGVSRDVVDETMQNIQSYNRRLYTNESGIGEEITARIESLKLAQELEEDTYGLNKNYDLESYEQEGYEGLKEDFNPETEE